MHVFLNSALIIGEWSASRPGHFTPGDRAPPVPIGQEDGWAPETVPPRYIAPPKISDYCEMLVPFYQTTTCNMSGDPNLNKTS
jgi:hypothetical protein